MTQQPVISYFLPPRIEYGTGAIRNLGVYVESFDGKKPLIATDAGVIRAGILSKAVESLENAQIEYTVFDDIEPNPTDLIVLNALEVYRAEACDLVIAIGGGSVMDAAKAIRLLSTHELPLERYFVDGGGIERITCNLPPLISVPTTAGTGSDVSQAAIITDTTLNTTDRWRKRAVVSPHMMSSLALLDAELTLGMPPALTAATGMDAVTHGIEAYVATRYHPISEGVALQTLRMLSNNICRAYHSGDDIEARGEMLLAASMAAFSFQKGLGAVHSLAHQLSSKEANIPHGVANAILLPHVMAFNLPYAVNRYAEVTAALGVGTSGMSKEEMAHAAIEKVHSLNRELGMPTGLGAAGLKQEHIPKLAKDAMLDHCYKFNPRPCSEADMQHLYEAAF
jgi:4-hydroxybutyrate dehydrogenase